MLLWVLRLMECQKEAPGSLPSPHPPPCLWGAQLCGVHLLLHYMTGLWEPFSWLPNFLQLFSHANMQRENSRAGPAKLFPWKQGDILFFKHVPCMPLSQGAKLPLKGAENKRNRVKQSVIPLRPFQFGQEKGQRYDNFLVLTTEERAPAPGHESLKLQLESLSLEESREWLDTPFSALVLLTKWWWVTGWLWWSWRSFLTSVILWFQAWKRIQLNCAGSFPG